MEGADVVVLSLGLGNDIEGEGASQLSAAVLANTRIERFNEIPIKEIRSGSLTSLDLAGKAIGVEGAMVVAGLALAMSSVTELNLTGNAIRDAGVSAICEAVQSNKETKLVALNVRDNEIGSEGATHRLQCSFLGGRGGVGVGWSTGACGVQCQVSRVSNTAGWRERGVLD